ncbi:pseudaminic acid cytidylyltransferase [Gammaproteobacteria bacterium]|nr:pseudaminic acid cytidylyltransferase [Gammaproteobacteria bacterium]
MNIAIIPARGGSKRIPFKNIKDFNGKPIIAYSIEKAIESGLFDKVVVSTDSEKIAKVAEDFGAEIPFLRPMEISDDFTNINKVISHALNNIDTDNYNFACCIFATSPLLVIEDLKNSYDLILKNEHKFVFSATEFPHPIQRGFKKNSSDKGLEMLFPEHYNTRSQDFPEWMHDAGQFYWGDIDSWLEEAMNFDENSFAYRLPRWRVQDIDTPDDWKRAELIFKVLKNF